MTNALIPRGKVYAVDSIKRVKRPKHIDWDALFLLFAQQEETTSATGWLRSIGWPQSKINNGNTKIRILDWRTKRAEIRRKIIDTQMDEAKQSFSQLLPQLVIAKRKIFMDYLHALENPKIDIKTRSHILTKIKTELGEPAIITKQDTEDVGDNKDPALTVLIAMGLINANGNINLQSDNSGVQTEKPSDNGEAAPNVA